MSMQEPVGFLDPHEFQLGKKIWFDNQQALATSMAEGFLPVGKTGFKYLYLHISGDGSSSCAMKRECSPNS